MKSARVEGLESSQRLDQLIPLSSEYSRPRRSPLPTLRSTWDPCRRTFGSNRADLHARRDVEMASVVLDGGMIALAGCDGRPAAISGKARFDVRTPPRMSRGARGFLTTHRARGGVRFGHALSNVSAGANDTAPFDSIQGASRHDEISYSAAIRAGTQGMIAKLAGNTRRACPVHLFRSIACVAYYGKPALENGWGC